VCRSRDTLFQDDSLTTKPIHVSHSNLTTIYCLNTDELDLHDFTPGPRNLPQAVKLLFSNREVTFRTSAWTATVLNEVSGGSRLTLQVASRNVIDLVTSVLFHIPSTSLVTIARQRPRNKEIYGSRW
jgi:hypothetical protein